MALHRARLSANAGRSLDGHKGKPQQNGFIEPFNARLRDECLNEEIFDRLADARRILARWRYDYNHERPHSAHGGLPPARARRALELFDGSAHDALTDTEQPNYEEKRLTS